ncbi:hypothetical protein HK102_009594 [Quaeritorhiza haematococci]|nr:hypothetical protein HK102_009594 [Quaeritorhiza haematococci]
MSSKSHRRLVAAAAFMAVVSSNVVPGWGIPVVQDVGMAAAAENHINTNMLDVDVAQQKKVPTSTKKVPTPTQTKKPTPTPTKKPTHHHTHAGATTPTQPSSPSNSRRIKLE